MKVSLRALLIGAAAVAMLGLAALWWPRPTPGPEELIRRKVVQMARAAEERDLDLLMEQISEQFRSQEGWGKDQLKAVLAAQLFRGNWVRVFPADLKVRLAGSNIAHFSGKFVFGRSEAKALADLARDSSLTGYGIEATVSREADGEWRFTEARHRTLSPEEML